MRAMIQNNILLWAIEQAQVATDTLPKKVGVKADKFSSWLNGEELPTFKQAQKLAKALHIPFGYLFLSEPPVEQLPVPDLRTIRNNPTYHPSIYFKELLYDLDRKQRWFREYIIENGAEELDFIGSKVMNDGIENIVNNIRVKLDWEVGQYTQHRTKDSYMTEIVRKAETQGILVMRSSYAGTGTQHTVSVTELRGLAIADHYAPLIFVNSSDAHSAQIFTLAHELAHLWIGQSAISDINFLTNHDEEIERFCNKVAAELLLPAHMFIQEWSQTESVDINCTIIARQYHVSYFVALKRAYDLNYINYNTYNAYYQNAMSEWEEHKARQDNNQGGDYYRTKGAKESRLFSQAVVSATLEGKLLYRDAFKLLNIKKTKVFEQYAKEIGVK